MRTLEMAEWCKDTKNLKSKLSEKQYSSPSHVVAKIEFYLDDKRWRIGKYDLVS